MTEETAGALVAQGEALMRLENETLMQVAIQRPRNEEKALAASLQELELVPEEAATAYYSIPYKDRSGEEEKTVYIEGPSIKAAMTLARRWGNCSAGGRILSEDAEGFNLEGVWLDHETHFRFSRPGRSSKWLKRRDGKVQLLTPDRMIQRLQADISKAVRGAILGGIPAPIVNAYYKRAKELVAKGPMTRKAGRAKYLDIAKGFEQWKVTLSMLEGHIKKAADIWTNADIATLRGLWNAITDKQVTVEEVFAASEPTKRPEGNGAVTPESLLGGTATGKDGQSPVPQAPVHDGSPGDATAASAPAGEELPLGERFIALTRIKEFLQSGKVPDSKIKLYLVNQMGVAKTMALPKMIDSLSTLQLQTLVQWFGQQQGRE